MSGTPTRGAYELEDGTFVRTQGEIPKGQPVNKISIPVGHQELIEFINGVIARERTASGGASPEVGETPELEPDPAPELRAPPPPSPKIDEADARLRVAQAMRGLEVEEIEKRILESKGPTFARYFLAGVERFAVLGKVGWEHVHAFLQMHHGQIGVYDRGLHMLALMQIEEMEKGPPKPKSYKELNG